MFQAFGLNVSQRRNAKHWTQEVLAERADLDRSYIAGIEVGRRNPSLKSIASIARALGTSLVQLFENVPVTVEKKH